MVITLLWIVACVIAFVAGNANGRRLHELDKNWIEDEMKKKRGDPKYKLHLPEEEERSRNYGNERRQRE